jgi:hypothetical protein
VLAVDTNKTLLNELAAHTGGNAAIQPVHADIRTVLPQITQPSSVAVVVCMGDTLTHLSSKTDMTTLLGDVTQALAEGGRLVITYRDLTHPLRGTDRFIPVRSTPDQLLTCFLEYRDDDTVIVHDLLHTRSGDTWTQLGRQLPQAAHRRRLARRSMPGIRVDGPAQRHQPTRHAATDRHQTGSRPRGTRMTIHEYPAAAAAPARWRAP